MEGPGRVCTLVGIYRALDDVDGAVGEDAEEGVLQVQQADAVDAPVRRAEEQLARVRQVVQLEDRRRLEGRIQTVRGGAFGLDDERLVQPGLERLRRGHRVREPGAAPQA